MNRYPLWKNIMVIGVVLVALFIASPNMCGDEEAVHITRTDGVAVDEATLSQVTAALSNANIPYTAADLDDSAALVRFPSVGEQLRANDVLREALPNHVVALTIAPRTPRGWH